MMRMVLILAAVSLALLAVLALTRGGPRQHVAEIPSPRATPLVPQAAPPAAAKGPVEPQAPATPAAVDVQLGDDAAAVGMTTREASPADQPEKKQP